MTPQWIQFKTSRDEITSFRQTALIPNPDDKAVIDIRDMEGKSVSAEIEYLELERAVKLTFLSSFEGEVAL